MTAGTRVDFETLCTFHPAFALAILNGVPLRPSERVVKAVFNSATTNAPVPASFDQFITSYSVFAGVDASIDPTGIPTSSLKPQADFFVVAGASGITVTILARTNNDQDYSPIPSDTPLQMVPSVLNRAIGKWHMANPDNIKAQFTLGSTPQNLTPPFTVWMTFAFLVLGPTGEDYLRKPALQARKELYALLAALKGSNAPASP